jgi:hypothetical protein
MKPESHEELKKKLDVATERMKGCRDPATREQLTEDVRELERLVQIAAEGDRPEAPRELIR